MKDAHGPQFENHCNNTCDTINGEKEEVSTLTKVIAGIRGLKSGKAAGEDEIQPEMRKAWNGERVRW